MQYFGAAYYPELVAPQEWNRDLERMADAGMNVVRLAEAAWLYLESDEGRFSFDWFDRVLELCERHKIAVVLGTPAFIPPAWMVLRYAEILPSRPDGRRTGLGGRHHYCLHSEHFLEASRRVVQAMAEHYGAHPAVIGWQVHNEFGLSTCYCDRCLAAWHRWLAERYQTVTQLNRAWGNQCWGHDYAAFEQIQFPSEASQPPEGGLVLPHVLAHHRFRSDDIRQYQRLQIAELRPRIGGR
jgi:beta-galactosidase